MSGVALRRALGHAARMLGVRAESTVAAPAAAAASGKLSGLSEALPSSDPIMQPYYQQIAEMEVFSAASPRQASESEREVRRLPRRSAAAACLHPTGCWAFGRTCTLTAGCPLAVQSELAMLRMHNMSLPRSVYEGHMIKATVLEVRLAGSGCSTRVARCCSDRSLPPAAAGCSRCRHVLAAVA